MKRRNFLIMGSIVGISPYLQADTQNSFNDSFKKVKATIAAVQEHMFPEGSKIPSAKSMHATQFLFETIKDVTYDKDIRAFVLEGANELIIREKGKFIFMNQLDKEKALRNYEKTRYGKNWLSRIMTLSMEAIFSDPVYGSNINEKGWKALNSFGGMPRPKTRYIKL